MNTIYKETGLKLNKTTARRMLVNIFEASKRVNRVILCGPNVIVYAEYKGSRKDKTYISENLEITSVTHRVTNQ